MSIADLLERLDWDSPHHRQHFLREWLRAPRQHQEDEPAPAPDGFRPCPAPSAGRHVFLQGHKFTEDGKCWIRDDR